MAGVFIGWTRPVRGREQQATKVFGEFMQFLGQQTQQGNVQSIEPVLLRPHGGDLGGFVLVHGDPEKLDAMERSDEFRRLVARANYIVEGFGVVDCITGEEVQRFVSTSQDLVADLRQ